MSKQEMSAEWITKSLTKVLARYPESDIKETMPVILMFMAKEFGMDNLEPCFQDAVNRVICAAGCTPDMTHRQVAIKMRIFVDGLNTNEQLLRDIKKVFDRHHSALSERVVNGFKRLVGLKTKQPAKVGEARPKDALTIDNFSFARRL